MFVVDCPLQTKIMTFLTVKRKKGKAKQVAQYGMIFTSLRGLKALHSTQVKSQVKTALSISSHPFSSYSIPMI